MVTLVAPEIPRCPDWTTEWNRDPPGRAVLAVDDGTRTLLLAADGRRVRAVSELRSEDPGQLSPEGARLALVVEEPGSQVAVLDLAEAVLRVFPAAVPGTEVLAWLPSGRRLLYGGDDSMHLLDLVTGISHPYDLDGADVREVAVAPEGDRIAVDVGADVQIAPLAGGEPILLPLTREEWLGAQGWSPDGRLLAVGRDSASSVGGEFDLAVTMLDTRGFQPAHMVVVPGLTHAGVVGWRDPDSVVLAERSDGLTRVVVRGLDGVEQGELTRIHGPVVEVRAATDLLRVVGTAPPSEVDLGRPPRWRRTVGTLRRR